MILNWGETAFESYRAYRADLVTFEKLPREALRYCVQAAARWLDAMPGLRYRGELPCWVGDCPLCGGNQQLWVVPVDPSWWLLDQDERPPGYEDRWQCHACNARGPDPASLAAAITRSNSR